MSEEKAIIQRFKAGDAAAFDAIYNKYSKKHYFSCFDNTIEASLREE